MLAELCAIMARRESRLSPLRTDGLRLCRVRPWGSTRAFGSSVHRAFSWNRFIASFVRSPITPSIDNGDAEEYEGLIKFSAACISLTSTLRLAPPTPTLPCIAMAQSVLCIIEASLSYSSGLVKDCKYRGEF